MKRFRERYSDIKEKLQFRYEFAIALYNLFTKEGFIKVTTKKPYPNNVVNCITKILDFCLIPVTPKPASLFEDRSKIVRNWLRRNKLTEKLTYLSVIPSQERLPKYFEPDFLNISSPIKGADVITTAWYICERFDIPKEFAPDFAHIALCLKQVNFLIGHQLLLVPGSKSPSPFEQHNGLRTLVESLKGKKKITSLKFQIEGDEKEYQFTERLPIYLVEQAISKHYKMHEEDFEVDIIKGKVFQCQHPGHYHFSKENKFHLPAEQFAVRFVKSFHNYLLNELPPGEKDHYPSQKYFSIIAVMMQHSWFFNQVRDSEDFICEKIAHWFSLNVES